MNDAAAINAEASRQIREELGIGDCRRCKGHGLIAGDNADGVFFDTCPKCKGTGFSSDQGATK